jgi:hypothetical protein
MAKTHSKPAAQTDPNDPPPQEDPTHDVPVFPEEDPPLPGETAIQAAHPGEGGGEPAGGEEQHDVDEDDLDPQQPHSPPDAGKRVIFDENEVAR